MIPLFILDLEPSVFVVTPVGTTDADSATLIAILFASALPYETDPLAATVVVIAQPNPLAYETDPTAATVVRP